MQGSGISLPGFHPAQLDNGSTKLLKGWFSARDSRQYTLTSGRGSSWLNKVTGVAATEPASNGPVLDADGLNGGPCFRGNADAVLLTTESALLDLWAASSGLQTHTIIVFGQLDAVPNVGDFLGVGRSDQAFEQSSGLASNSLVDSANCWTVNRTGASNNTQWFGGTPDTSPVAVAYRFDGSDPLIRIAGVNETMATTAASTGSPPGAISTPNRLALFCRGRSTLSGKIAGAIGEIFLYQGQLSDAECDVAADAARAWYGLARLT